MLWEVKLEKIIASNLKQNRIRAICKQDNTNDSKEADRLFHQLKDDVD